MISWSITTRHSCESGGTRHILNMPGRTNTGLEAPDVKELLMNLFCWQVVVYLSDPCVGLTIRASSKHLSGWRSGPGWGQIETQVWRCAVGIQNITSGFGGRFDCLFIFIFFLLLLQMLACLTHCFVLLVVLVFDYYFSLKSHLQAAYFCFFF